MSNRDMWERRHKASGFRFNRVTQFAKDVYHRYLKDTRGKLLDLGCGKGADSIFFHYKGFDVTAVDFSKNAISKFNEIQKNKEIFITAFVRDITEPFMAEDDSYDLIYSRISLNYFTDKVTKKVFKEIKRVLKSEGLLIFQVKSDKDKDFGVGKEIEPNVFEDEKESGYLRHFFSKEYVKKLLGKSYEIVLLEDLLIRNGNAYLNVIAKKK